jgi:hypothetical protein
MRGRVTKHEVAVLASLLGAYLLYAAFFSQAVMIHPYLYDVMLFTPLVVALFSVVPALVESITDHRGIAVLVAVFLAIWVSLVQLRQYALRYPQPEKVTSVLFLRWLPRYDSAPMLILSGGKVPLNDDCGVVPSRPATT